MNLKTPFSILLLIQLIHSQTIVYKAKCTCIQLLNQADCERNTFCIWNTHCVDKRMVTPDPAAQLANSSYCQQFTVNACSRQRHCAWIGSQCAHFTGCSAYTMTTDEDCLKISRRCFKSDGERCIEMGPCNTYNLESACTLNQLQKFCFWDKNRCVDALICEQLPKTFKTDRECRTQIDTCTALPEGGCTKRGIECKDNLYVVSCFNNLQNDKNCFWDFETDSCRERVCENASTKLKTDLQCSQFLSTCTTKINGGCVLRNSCSAAIIQAACVKNQLGDDCYWRDGACAVKVCESAPLTLNTNSLCAGFKEGCITKQGGGCMQVTECNKISLQQACVQNSRGESCIWNPISSQCLDKKCENAPVSNKTHEDCQRFLSECTVKGEVGGCQVKDCSNAPKHLTKNSDCFAWLPQSKCITTLGGGCVTNTTCDRINIRTACISDSLGNECFWTGTQCRLKVCSNAPPNFNDHSKCFSFMATCTVNSTQDGCVDRTCANLLTPGLCTSDLNNNPCIWKPKCFEKSCSSAPASFNTHQQCYSYLARCTVNLLKTGCMEIPVKCDFLTRDQCYVNRKGDICGWNGERCTPKSCQTAPLAIISNELCSQYKSGCILSNTGAGCMLTPLICFDRKTVQNCEFGNPSKCAWRNNNCIDRTCQTSQNAVCNSYQALTPCIVNSQNTGCVPKPSSCEGLAQVQCGASSSLLGDCYFQVANSRCVSKTCPNLSLSSYSHNSCNAEMASCTVANTLAGCMELLPSCQNYLLPQSCVVTKQNQPCAWFSGSCRDRTCEDAPDTSSFVQLAQCSAFKSGCTVASSVGGVGCTVKGANCFVLGRTQCWPSNNKNCYYDGYTCREIIPQTQCSQIVLIEYSHAFCTKVLSNCTVSGSTCIERTCQNATSDLIGSFTLTNCKAWKGSCVPNRGGSSCIEAQSCDSYTSQDQCLFGSNGTSCIWSGVCSTVQAATPCANLTPAVFNDQICQELKAGCKKNGGANACAEMQNDCSGYSLQNDCTVSKNFICFWDVTCKSVTANTTCLQLKLGTYTVAGCQALKSTCTAGVDQCVEKTCGNKTVAPFKNKDCQQWLPSCASNKAESGCVQIKDKCGDYTVEQECGNSAALPCFWNGTKCVDRTCGTTYTNLTSHNACEEWLGTCTKNRAGGCQLMKLSCGDYQTENACIRTSNNQACAWKDSQCIISTCDLFTDTTHGNCQTKLATCTVNDAKTACMVKKPCDQYKIAESCFVDNEGRDCVWKGGSPGSCVRKACSTIIAPATTYTHADCQGYINTCTVSSDGSTCIPLTDCSAYTTQIQCVKSAKNENCAWNGQACGIRSCVTASTTISTHAGCQAYISGCTVSHSGQGCIPIPDTCLAMSSEEQCRVTSTGVLCFWNSESIPASCQERVCANAPTTALTAQGCAGHLSLCTSEIFKCRQKVCEDFAFKTNFLCQQALAYCTTDGQKCVPRLQCEHALVQEACVVDNQGQQCQWMNGDATDPIAYCTLKTCDTAPKSLNSDFTCKSYLAQCTTRLGGGCIVRSTCEAAQLETACIVDRNGTQCIWEGGKCRDLDCVDFAAPNHASCKRIRPNCTSNGQGRCQRILTCQDTTIAAACVEGTDGPCLWVPQVGCIRFDGCNSIAWTTDEACKRLSPNCTTNGTNCIAISKCAQNNLNGGCVTGTDGMCVQSRTGTEDNADFVCRVFQKCSDAYFNTHEHCQAVNRVCTTNGESQCMNLQECSEYINEAHCRVNLKGLLRNSSGRITSTGVCVWDQINCRDQICSDLRGITDEECGSQLVSCTTDGRVCQEKKKCSDYSEQLVCQNGLGLDGNCIWGQSGCKLMGCEDIANGSEVEACSALAGCVSDGEKCIKKTSCYSYKNAISCINGSSDQTCIWVDSSSGPYCAIMTSCQFANNDEVSCRRHSDKCSWVPRSEGRVSSCDNHNCQSQAVSSGSCNPLASWDRLYFRICTMQDGACKETQTSQLTSSNCYTQTSFQYTWDPTINLCVECKDPVIKNNQTLNNTGNNSSTTDPDNLQTSSSIIISRLLIFQIALVWYL